MKKTKKLHHLWFDLWANKLLLLFIMPKPVFIHQFFTTECEGRDRVSTCIICNQTYNRPSGSTGSLRNHLSSKHHQQYLELLDLERSGAEKECLRKSQQLQEDEQQSRSKSKYFLENINFNIIFREKITLLTSFSRKWCKFSRKYDIFLIFYAKYIFF